MENRYEILFEETTEINGQTYWVGHTREYIKVAVLSEKDLENQVRNGGIEWHLYENVILMTSIMVEFPR
ncbi:MAG: hypothetical protein ACLU9V_01555 [Roseburia sp.]